MTAIRLARPDDAPALAEIRYRFRAAEQEPVEGRIEFVDRCASWMSSRLAARTPWRCWVAEADGRVVGTIWLQIIEKLPNPVDEAEIHGYISSAYVEPAMRDSGIGSMLLDACIGACSREGVDALILWPTQRSRSLYERYGFAVRDDLLERRL
jgi:ribosomal protein S18 acetylase RimI-like enzyme